MPRSINVESRLKLIQNLENAGIVTASNRVVTRQQILQNCGNVGYAWLVNDSQYRAERGKYNVPFQFEIENLNQSQTQNDDSDLEESFLSTFNDVNKSITIDDVIEKNTDDVLDDGTRIIGIDLTTSLVPAKIASYVPWGHWRDCHRILKSGRFMNIYLTGFTGNGKTTMIEQLCADLGRDFIRANITQETDEMDLIGGFRLQNGETVFEYGPVVNAMLRGAVLLLDEVDLASSKVMCLQPVLEGKPIFVKKINKWIHPKPGFVVIATANTKGRGSDSGHFIGTNFLNEAFLDRFAITLEQPYAPAKQEQKILNKFYQSIMGDENIPEEVQNITKVLVAWAGKTRKQFEDGSINDMISTRRLLDIVNHYTIFNDISKAVTACTARFSEMEAGSFRDLFKLMYDESVTPKTESVTETVTVKDDDCPFY